MQVHYLTSRIKNQFIEIYSSLVQEAILDEIRNNKYFSRIIDATPDYSHKQQTTPVNRYVNITDSSTYSIEERVISFDNFTKKTCRKIQKLLKFEI